MKVIDLSQTLNSQSPVYPGDDPVALTQTRFLEADGCNGYFLQTGLHTGTHIDMPMHMLSDLRMADSFPLEQFTGRGVVIDVRGESTIGLKTSHYDLIRMGDAVLLYTGWDVYFSDAKKYFGHHPVVAPELADFLAARKIKMLGVDMPSPDTPPFPVHKLLLSQGIFIVENLTNLEDLTGLCAIEFFAVPLKISAEASAVRAFARSL